MRWYKYDIRKLSDKEYQKWFYLMDGDKQRRVSRFRYTDDKKRTVTGEMLARKAISEWCDVKPENIRFAVGEHKKPHTLDLEVEFNISHSGDMVVCAVDDTPVGIDIEMIRPIDLLVARHICTENELLYLFGQAPKEKDFAYTEDMGILTRFFEIWTIKEAYMKCRGNVDELKKINTDIYRLKCKPLSIKGYSGFVYGQYFDFQKTP